MMSKLGLQEDEPSMLAPLDIKGTQLLSSHAFLFSL